MAKNNHGCGCLVVLLLLGGVFVANRHKTAVKVAGGPQLPGKLTFLHKLDSNGAERQEAERILQRRDPTTMDAIAALVRDSGETDATRALALRALLASGDPRFLALAMDCLRTGPPELVQAARAILAAANDPTVHAALLAALASRDQGLQLSAALVLGQKDDARAVEHLIRIMQSDGEQKAAGEVLARMTPPPSLEPLLELLASPRHNARAAVAEMLGRSKDPRAVPALLAALKSDDDGLAGAAAGSLARLARAEGGSAVVDKLGTILRDRSALGATRKRAAEALGAIGDSRAAKHLMSVLKERNATVREAADAALVAARERKLETATYAGQDPHRFATAEQMYAHAASRRELDARARELVAAVGRQLESKTALESPAVQSNLAALDPYVPSSEVQAAVQQWAGVVAEEVRSATPTGGDQAQAMKAAGDEYRRGAFAAAAGRYAAILRTAPGHLDARNDLALAEIHLGHDTLAEVELEVLRKLDEKYAPAQVNLTVVYERIWPGDRQKASTLAYGVPTASSAPAAFNAAWYRNAAREYPRARELLLPLAGLDDKFDELARVNGLQAAGR